MLAPIVAKNRASPLSIFRRAIISPRMHSQDPGALRAAVPENLVRPPAFEISATPDTRTLHMRKFQCAIDPTTAPPFRRAHVPIRMIVE